MDNDGAGPAAASALRDRIAATFAEAPLLATFGAELLEVAPGLCRIGAPILPGARQQDGFGHAGLTFTLGDSAAGFAALTLMQAAARVLTVEMKVNLLVPAAGDRLIAEGRVVRAGRRLTVVAADVHAEAADGRRHVAVLQGTMVAHDA